jgi:hypothetical protein
VRALPVRIPLGPRPSFGNVARWLDDLGQEYPECHVALIDALRDYIRNLAQTRRDLLDEGALSIEEAREHDPHLERCQALLEELEDHSFDPSLCGLLRGK